MKKAYYYWAIALVVFLGGGYYWYSQSNSNETQTEYVTEKITKGTLTTSVSASGNVVVDQLATVDPTISGTVTNLSVKVGDSVEEGQLLFEIVNDDLEITVKKAEDSLKQAENNVETKEVAEDQAEADYEAAVKKDKKDPTTYTKEQLEVLEDKIDLAENAVDEAKKSLETTRSEYQNQKNEADKRRVTSPIKGTVNEINIKNGDDLGKNSTSNSASTPIIIGDLKTLKVEVAVNEVDIPKVSIGQKAVLKLNSLDDLSVSGKVEKIDALGTASQGVVTYKVTIGFDTLDERIKPEMSVTASIITEVKQNVLIAPNGAIKQSGDFKYVEVLENEKPNQAEVQTGITNDTETEIKSGISEGQEVVTQTISGSSSSNSNNNKSSSSGFRMPGMGGGVPH